MAGLYIHIPFCKQACYYCDFFFSTRQEQRSELSKAIASELGMQKNYLDGEKLETIYFGGGTPSILLPGELDEILNAIHANFSIANQPEVTLEANPDDLTKEKIEYLFRAGINRLSVGIQSFDDSILKSLNRAHDNRVARGCIEDAQSAGFRNISVDLIYAIPGLTDDAWEKGIREAIALRPQHVSSYSLTIEDKTVFGKWTKQGKMKRFDDDLAAHQLNLLIDVLEADGFEHYEVSNFSKQDFQSRHNSNYWKNKKYLGVGPSAHSYNGESRQYNVSNNAIYTRFISQHKVPFTLEVLSREDKINEYLLTTLRTCWGADLNILRDQFSFDILNESSDYIKSLQNNGIVVIEDNILRLTRQGRFHADKIASDLFVVEH